MMVPFFNAPATYPEALASTDKCLAQGNKSCTGNKATKNQSGTGVFRVLGRLFGGAGLFGAGCGNTPKHNFSLSRGRYCSWLKAGMFGHRERRKLLALAECSTCSGCSVC